jgi:hypothetical protein
VIFFGFQRIGFGFDRRLLATLSTLAGVVQKHTPSRRKPGPTVGVDTGVRRYGAGKRLAVFLVGEASMSAGDMALTRFQSVRQRPSS